MEHSQSKVMYYPKRDEGYSWEGTPTELTAYLDYQAVESIGKKTDAGQIPFNRITFDNRYGTYNAGTLTFTCTGANWVTNQWRWFTLVNNTNRFVIQSNTANTITLAPASSFYFPAAPISGEVNIELPEFTMGDILVFYGWKADNDYTEPALDGDKILFVGQVVAITQSAGDTGVQDTLKISNMSELLLKYRRAFKIFGTSINTAPLAIRYIIDLVNASNQGTLQLTYDNSSIPLFKKDGVTPFKTITYIKDDKSAGDVVSELSTNTYTGDGDYFFYIIPISPTVFKFYWKPITNTVTSNLVEGDAFTLINRSVDRAEVLSHVLVRAGLDARGRRISVRCAGSMKEGTRARPVSVDISGEIIENETINKPTDWDTSAVSDALYPLTYPYTTHVSVTPDEVLASPGKKLVIGTMTVNTKGEWNSFLINLTRARAIIYGQDILRYNGELREKITLLFLGQPSGMIPGTLDRLTIPSIGWTGGKTGTYDYRKLLRVQSKNIRLTNNGIGLEVTYEQDWVTAE